MNKKSEMRSLHLLNHSKCILAAFQNFRQDETMLDVTLACKGMSLKAHKMVLSACSPFFKKIFADNPCEHPIVFMKDVEFADLKALVDFIYKGELLVPRERLVSTLKVAEELQVRGLMRSESHREDYEKLYKKICEKQYGRRRRKRHRQSSSESEEKECFSDSVVSDQGSLQSEDSVSLAETVVPDFSEIPHYGNLDSNHHSSSENKDMRPVVLRVGEPSVSAKDSDSVDNLGNLPSSEEHAISDASESQEKISACDEVTEKPTSELPLSSDNNNILSPSFDSFTTCPETNEMPNAETEEATSSMVDAENVEETVIDIKPSDAEQGLDIPKCSEDQPISSVLSYDLPSTSKSVNHNDEKVSQLQLKQKGRIMGFECRTCGRVFTSRPVLIRHEIMVHKATDSSLPFKCRFCPFAARKASRLKYHMLIHSKQRMHKCAICSKGFKFDHQLQQHLTIHTEEELLACREYPSKFKRPGSLFVHSRYHSEKTPFMCRHCCKKIFNSSDLLKHEETCEGEMQPERSKILNVDSKV